MACKAELLSVINPRKRIFIEQEGGQDANAQSTWGEASRDVATEYIRYGNIAELCAALAVRLQNLKLVDMFATFERYGNHAGFRAAFNSALNQSEAVAVDRLRFERSEAGRMSFEVREYVVSALGRDLFKRILTRMEPHDISYYLSPINEPRLTPHVVLTGPDMDQGVLNMFAAANYCSARVVPFLIITSPLDNSVALQLSSDLAWPEGVDLDFSSGKREAENQRTSGGASFRLAIESALARANESLVQLFPDATMSALVDLSPAYVTLIPGNNVVPYELTRIPQHNRAGRIAWEARSMGEPDESGRLSLMYRLGRLCADTDENTCRMICHACISSHVYRGDETRLALVSNPNGDLPRADAEGRMVSKLATRINEDAGLPLILLQTSGSEATSGRFREICNSSVDFIHFAGHGKTSFMDPFESTIQCSDASVSSLELANDLVLLRNPVVFFNACEIGRMPGFIPTALFRAFAGSVVATLWPVFDEAAARVASVFLGWVLGGAPIGAALQHAKIHAARHNSGKAATTGESYILYGDPLAVPFLSHFPLLQQLTDLTVREIGESEIP